MMYTENQPLRPPSSKKVNIYYFMESLIIIKKCQRYGVNPAGVFDAILHYIKHRNNTIFILLLQNVLGREEPFFKQELKSTLLSMIELYDRYPPGKLKVINNTIFLIIEQD